MLELNKYRISFDYAKVVLFILVIGILPSIYVGGQVNSSLATETEVAIAESENGRTIYSSLNEEDDNNEPTTQIFEGGNLNITLNATTFYPGQNIGINITAFNSTLNGTFSWYIESPSDDTVFNSINKGYQQEIRRGDLDNDGLEEFFVGSYDGLVRILNIANDEINKEASFDLGRNAFGLTIGDVHNDSNLDLVASGDDGEIYIISHNGSTYSINTTIPIPDRELITEWQQDYWQGESSLAYHRYGLAVGDVHNDSMTDLVVGDSIGLVHVYTWDKTTHSFALNWTSTETTDLALSERMIHDAYSIAIGNIRRSGTDVNVSEIFVGANPGSGAENRDRSGVHVFRWNATTSTFNESLLIMRQIEGGTEIEPPIAKIVSLAIANITEDEHQNLVVAFASDSQSVAVLTEDTALDDRTDFFLFGQKVFGLTAAYGSPVDFLVFDMDNDTITELLVSTSGGTSPNTLFWYDFDRTEGWGEAHVLMDTSSTLGGLAYALEANFTADTYQILMAVNNGSLFLVNVTGDGIDLVLDPTFGGIGSIEYTLYSDPTLKTIQTPLAWEEIVGLPHNTQGQFISAADNTGYGPSYYFYDPVNKTIPVFYLRRNGTVSYLWDRTSRTASGTPTLFSDITSFKWQVDVLNNTQNNTGSITYISINGTLPEVPMSLGTYKLILVLNTESETKTYEVAFTVDEDIVYKPSDVELWIKKGIKYTTTVRLQNTTENVTHTNTTTYYSPNYLKDTSDAILSPGDEIIFITSFFYGSNESIPVDTQFVDIQASGAYDWQIFTKENLTWSVTGYDADAASEPDMYELSNHTLYDDDATDNQTHWVYYNNSLVPPNNTDIAFHLQIPDKGIYGEANGTIDLQWGYGTTLFNSSIVFENITIFYKLLSPDTDPITDPSHYPEDNELLLGEKVIKSFTLIPSHYNETLDDLHFSDSNTTLIIENNDSHILNSTWGIINASLPLNIPSAEIHLNITCLVNGTNANIFTLWSPVNYTYTYYGFVDPNTPTGNYSFSLIWEDARQANTTLSSYELFNVIIRIIGSLHVNYQDIHYTAIVTQGEVFRANFTVILNETGELMKDLDLYGFINNNASLGYVMITDEAGTYFIYLSVDARRFAPGNHTLSVLIKTTDSKLFELPFTVLSPPTEEAEEEVPFIAYPIALGGLVVAILVWCAGMLRIVRKKS